MTEADWIAFFRRPEIPAFNAMILEHPDADLPRLVFADWVEENCPHTPFVMALRRSIANPETPEWVPNFSMVVKGHELRLWRGRIEVGIDCSDPEFESRPDAFVKAAWDSGWVGRVKVRGIPAGTPQLGRVFWRRMGGVEYLDLYDAQVPQFGFWLSTAASDLSRLTTLDLRLNQLTADDIHRLAGTTALGSLKLLLVSDGYLSESRRRTLAESKTLPEHIRAQFRRPA